MCVICRGTYNSQTVSINCDRCPNVRNIPILPNLEKLKCSGCMITEIPLLPNLQHLECHECPIKEIPLLPRLKALFCGKCPLIKEIPMLPNLNILFCSGTSIQVVPQLLELNLLFCTHCKLLTTIPYLPKLREFRCWKSPLLLSTPKPATDAEGCKWLNRTDKMTADVVILQRWWKRIYAKRLPIITEFFIPDLAKMILKF